MTQEEKELLLKDLCARLIYGVMCDRLGQAKKLLSVSPNKDYCIELDNGEYTPNKYKIEDVKPYLRPMASMTEEEIKKYRTLQDTACSYHYEFGDIVDDFLYFDNEASLSYLNSIHIDYRGLIPMGLALEATEDMYK